MHYSFLHISAILIAIVRFSSSTSSVSPVSLPSCPQCPSASELNEPVCGRYALGCGPPRTFANECDMNRWNCLNPHSPFKRVVYPNVTCTHVLAQILCEDTLSFIIGHNGWNDS